MFEYRVKAGSQSSLRPLLPGAMADGKLGRWSSCDVMDRESGLLPPAAFARSQPL